MNQIRMYRPVTYTPVNNEPLRQFDDVGAIGMLAYLCSHIDGFTITKTFLQNRFGRAAATNALKYLEEQGYFLSFKVRKGNKNIHVYYVSDVKFDETTTRHIAKQIMQEDEVSYIMALNGLYHFVVEEDEFRPKSSIVENRQLNKPHDTNDSSIVENQQLKPNSGKTTVQNQPQEKTKDLKEKDLKKTNSQKTKTKTSSSPLESSENVSRETIRNKLIETHGEQSVRQVEQNLTEDPSVSIVTDKQYFALMTYRLKHLFKKPQVGPEPDWLEEEKRKQKAFEKERAERLIAEVEEMSDEELERLVADLS